MKVRELILNVTLGILCFVGILAVIAVLVGLGFETVKWLGHTQK